MPTPHGDVAVSVNESRIEVTTAGGNGLLRFKSRRPPHSGDGDIQEDGSGGYEMKRESGKHYVVNYTVPEAENQSR